MGIMMIKKRYIQQGINSVEGGLTLHEPLRRFWHLRGDSGIMFDQFHYFSSLPCRFSSCLMTLIHKVKHSSHLGDFRPISQVGSLLKLVVKVLVIRFAKVMDNLVSLNQSVFLKKEIGWFTGLW